MTDRQASPAAEITPSTSAPPSLGDLAKPILGLALRHVAGAIAGGLVTHGWVNSSTGEQITGFIMAAGVVTWSWWNKRGRAMLEQDVANLRAILQARADQARTDALRRSAGKTS